MDFNWEHIKQAHKKELIIIICCAFLMLALIAYMIIPKDYSHSEQVHYTEPVHQQIQEQIPVNESVQLVNVPIYIPFLNLNANTLFLFVLVSILGSVVLVVSRHKFIYVMLFTIPVLLVFGVSMITVATIIGMILIIHIISTTIRYRI